MSIKKNWNSNAISMDLPLVFADGNRLQQILYNLLGNAIKFTPEGQVTLRARVLEPDPLGEQSRELGQVEVAIADTGIGIPPDKLSLIFNSFEQGDGSTARRYGGTGLGLAITKQLVELHGGQISVESRPGQGSEFRFTLPISPPDWQDDSEQQAQLTPLAGLESEQPGIAAALEAVSSLNANFGTGSNLAPSSALASPSQFPASLGLEPSIAAAQFKILIVDDEPVNLQVLANHLSLEKYAIIQASSGAEALELLETEARPDLVLLDVMMPEMTGYEVCKEIRKRFPANELPVLMLTAKSQVADVIEGLNEGANDYLAKPIRKQELLARLRTHLYLANMSMALNRFVPNQFLKLLDKKSIVDIAVGDQVLQQMSILFADIRDFTTLSERMTPEDNFRFINSYLARMEPAITQHYGFIDKYIGDAIMALFERSANDAVLAGLQMFERLAVHNQERIRKDYMPIHIGLGINTGDMILGTVGGSDHIDGTVIGDSVNVASRLEGLTKRYGVPLLISEFTYRALEQPEQFSLRRIDRVQVKGKSNWVDVYEVFDVDGPAQRALKLESRDRFEAAVELFHQGAIADAQALFLECARTCPQDAVVQYFLTRCRQEQP
ncbi:MAG: response regulator [Synechococcales cyanobacterium RM1_1_8]|nr:response regulator [Synechococcales cyanobacterium RM1_1_8]